MQESEDLVVLRAESANWAQEYTAVVIFFQSPQPFLYFTGGVNIIKLDLNYRGGLWNKTT